MRTNVNLKGTTSLAEYLRQTEIREHTIEYLVALGYAALIVGVEGRQAILAEMTERRARAWEMILLADDGDDCPVHDIGPETYKMNGVYTP